MNKVYLFQVYIDINTQLDVKNAYLECLLSSNKDSESFMMLLNNKHFYKSAIIEVSDGNDMEQINEAFELSNIEKIEIVDFKKRPHSASVGDIMQLDDQFYLVIGLGFENITDICKHKLY